VAPDLTAPGRPGIFVIGDTATIDAWHGKPVPGIAPAAKQQGMHVADTIKRRLAGDASPRPFRYRHAGNLATIGKRSAVIDFGWIKVRGYIAWWIWGLAHIYFLIGVRNRLAVALKLAVDLRHRHPQRLSHHAGRAAPEPPKILKKMPECRSAPCPE
jgi:NADH dehydrogenase